MSILKVNQITPYTGSTLVVSGSTLSIPGGTVSGTSLTGTLTTAAQPNITSLGTLTQLNTDNIRIDGNTISSQDTNGNIIIEANGTGDVIVNEGGGDSDFRVEGQTDQNLLFVDASASAVGIGVASSFGKLTINSNDAPASSGNMTTGLTVTNGTTGTAINLGTYDAGGYGYIQSGYVNNADVARSLAFFTGASEAMRIDSSGNVGIGTSSPATTLEVKGTGGIIVNRTSGDAFVEFQANGTSRALIYGATDGTGGRLQFFTQAAGGSNTERMRIDSDGDVGINNTNPTHALHIAGTDKGIRIEGGYVEIAYGSSAYFSRYKTEYSFPYVDTVLQSIAGASYEGRFIFQTNSNGGALATRATIDNSGYLRLAGGGIQFNGDTAAANALDDYEDGTWTMGIAFGGASAGVTYSLNTGEYTKIGRQVTVTGTLLLSNKGSSTGNATLTGLPFTIGNGSGYYSSPSMWFENISFANQFQAYGEVNNTTISLREITEAGSGSTLTEGNFANNSEIAINFTYFV